MHSENSSNKLPTSYDGKIFYPPRPVQSISPEKLSDYENKRTWLAQRKYNGTRTLIEFSPEGYKLWTRKKEENKQYKPSESMKQDLQDWHSCLGKDAYHVIDGEILHSKTKNDKDVFVTFDILVCENQYFIDSNVLERHEILYQMMGEPDMHEDISNHKMALKFTDKLWLAECFLFNFENEYKRFIEIDEIEGLVLKNLNGKLSFGHNEKNNDDWLISCRKPTKNYDY